MSMEECRDETHEVLAILRGEEDGVVRTGGIIPAGTLWYILSTAWFRRWKNFKGLTQADDDLEPPEENLGPIDNSDLLVPTSDFYQCEDREYWDRPTKERLVLDEDYLIIPPSAWRLLAAHYPVRPGSEIQRFSISTKGGETAVEVTLRRLKLAILVLDEGRLVEPKAVYFSRKSLVGDVKLRVRSVVAKVVSKEAVETGQWRVWVSNPSVEFLCDVKTQFLEGRKAFPGKLLSDDSATLDEADIGFETLLLAEFKSKNGNWHYSAIDVQPAKRLCAFCQSVLPASPSHCRCKRVLSTQFSYCNIHCHQKDLGYHTCEVHESPSTASSSKPLTPSDSPPHSLPASGVCGLQNLGNTCFMNSGLQCLSHTQELAQAFLDDSYKRDLNTANKIGTGGKLAKAFAALVKEMWAGRGQSVSPWGFKRELGDFVPQFYGFQQQDSHELITYTLDLLHEDLNRIKKKPTPKEISPAGLSETQLSERFWDMHLSRNRSIIVDLAHGQFRSQVTCPDCGHISLTFDPFVSVSVSFAPKTIAKAMEGFFVPLDLATPVKKFKAKVPRGATVAEFRASAARELSVSPQSIMVMKSHNQSLVEALGDDLPLGEFSQYYTFVAVEKPISPQQTAVLLDVYTQPDSRYYQKHSVGLSRLVVIDANCSLYDLHLAVFRLLERVKGLATQSQPQEDYEAAFRSEFLGESPAPYALTFVNLQREKSSGSYWIKERPLCDYCGKRDCANCAVPIATDAFLSTFIEKNKTGRILRIEAILPSKMSQDLSPLSLTHLHESIARYAEEERRLKEQSFTLQECLRLSALPEKLDADNEVYCAVCRKHVQAEKQMTLYRLPKILIIHLKRFKDRGYRKEKDERLIRFPVEGLNLSEFVPGENRMYDLYAVSNHYGGMGGGHYTAFAKDSTRGEWYCFNDSATAKIVGRAEDTIVTPAAYVLFYRRRDQVR